MTRLEYLDILEQKLKKYMTQKEVNDIVRDYAEYFEEGKAQGKSDEETAAKLGSPEKIAEEILAENNYDMELNSVPKDKNHFWKDIKEKTYNIFKSCGSGIKSFISKLLGGIKKLNIPNFLKNILWVIIGIPLGLIIAVLGLFLALVLVWAILAIFIGLLAFGVALFIPAILLIASAGIVWEFFYMSIPILAIICGVGCLALGLCFIGLAFVIFQDTKKFITGKIKNGKKFSSKQISENKEGCENND